MQTESNLEKALIHIFFNFPILEFSIERNERSLQQNFTKTPVKSKQKRKS